MQRKFKIHFNKYLDMSNLFSFSTTESNIKSYFEYVPIIVIAIVFVTDVDLDEHILQSSFKLFLSVVCLSLLYFLLTVLKMYKPFALFVVFILWVVVIYFKRQNISFKK